MLLIIGGSAFCEHAAIANADGHAEGDVAAGRKRHGAVVGTQALVERLILCHGPPRANVPQIWFPAGEL